MWLIKYNFSYDNYDILGYVETENEAKVVIDKIKSLIPSNPFTSDEQWMSFEKILEYQWRSIEDTISDDWWENVAKDGVEIDSKLFTIENAKLNDIIKKTRYNWFKENHSGFAELVEPYFAWLAYPYSDINSFSYEKVNPFKFSNLKF